VGGVKHPLAYEGCYVWRHLLVSCRCNYFRMQSNEVRNLFEEKGTPVSNSTLKNDGGAKMLTSIIQNKGDSTSIFHEFRTFCRSSRQIKIAVAFALETGAKHIVGLFKQCKIEPGTITVIVGTSFHITEPDALRTLLDYGIKLRVLRAGHTYHPKVYCFEHNGYRDILIGSANLSASAFTTNVEVMIHHRAQPSTKIAKDLSSLFADLEKKSIVVTRKWIAQYESNRKPRPYDEVNQKNVRTKALNLEQYKPRSEIMKLLDKKNTFSPAARRLEFKNKVYVFTGIFEFGTHRQCGNAVMEHGGKCERTVTRHTDYLIVGTGGNPNYYWEKYGRKIALAKRYSGQNGRPIIVPEDRFRKSLGSS